MNLKLWIPIWFSCVAIGVVIGCAAFRNGAAPTAVEQQIYNVRTNYLEVVVPRTNYIPVTVFATNTQGVVQTVTNYQIVTVSVTNEVPQYVYTEKPAAAGVTSTVGTAVNTFFPGIGGLVSTGITALIGLWGYVRSSKNYNTSAVLAQNVQMARAFMQQLPNGGAMDTAFTNFIQAHQADAGVLQGVLNLIKNEVDNTDAQDAAKQIQSALTALSTQTPSAGPPAAPHA